MSKWCDGGCCRSGGCCLEVLDVSRSASMSMYEELLAMHLR
jgi:hypothetical protein